MDALANLGDSREPTSTRHLLPSRPTASEVKPRRCTPCARPPRSQPWPCISPNTITMPVLVAVSHATRAEWRRRRTREVSEPRGVEPRRAPPRRKKETSRDLVVNRVRRGRPPRRQALVRRVRRPPRSPTRSRVRPSRPSRPSRPRRRGGALSAADAAASSRGGTRRDRSTRAFPRGSRASRKTFRKRVALSPTDGRCFRGRRRTRSQVLGEAGIEDTVGDLSGRVEDGSSAGVRDASRGSRGTRHFGVAAARFAILSGEKATVRVERERPIDKSRDHAPGPRACRGDLVDGLEVKKKVEPSLEAICGGFGGVERAARVSRRRRVREETLIIIATETKTRCARRRAESRDRARRSRFRVDGAGATNRRSGRTLKR